MAWRVGIASKLHLDPLGRRQQRVGIKVGLDRDAGVQKVLLPNRAGLWLGLVHPRASVYPHAVAVERIAAGAQVGHPVAEVRSEPEPGLQSLRSFHTSTVTS